MKRCMCVMFLLILVVLGIFFLYPLNIDRNTEQKWVFYDRNGEILYTEKPFFDSQNWENAFLEKSIISLEDQNFYEHIGVDFKSLIRASWQNLQSDEIVSGASTITMQLSKLFFLESTRRDYWYKFRQILYALKVDFQLDKEEILRNYLEKINFGNGAIGISAASQKYFNKNPANLSISEIASLLGTIQNPARFNPLQNPAKNTERRNFILERLKNNGVINSEDFEFWQHQKVKLNLQFSGEIVAPHFVFWVRNQLELQDFSASEIHVHTTLDKKLYESTLRISREIIKKQGQEKNISNGAVVVLDSANNVRVMMGSPDFFNKEIYGEVNLTISQRQVGSVLKPFLYAFSLDQNFSPLQGIRDEKQIFSSGYFPRNFNISEENGIVRFRESLANSYNIAAVDLLNQVGLDKFYNFCQNELELDFKSSADDLGLSLILGSAESNLLDLSQSYSIFPNKGILKPLQFLKKVEDEKGELLWQDVRQNVAKKTVLTLDSAEWGTHVLSDNEARWKNFSRGNSLELDFQSGAKTGTSQEFKDNWVLGFSSEYTVGVWVGNADGSSMYASSGMQGAGPIWQKVMQLLHDEIPQNFSHTGNRTEKIICRRPGEKDCQETVRAFILSDEISQEFTAVSSLNYPSKKGSFEIMYPRDGDVFMKNSDLLIQVSGENSAKFSYFLNNQKLKNAIINDLSSGFHSLRVENEYGEKRHIQIEVR